LPKTLAEIAIDAGLVTKANAARAGKLAEERGVSLVVVLIRELAIDELALVGAFAKQTRVQILDPKNVAIDQEALRAIPRDIASRRHVLPLGLASDGKTKVLRIAMADPTDTAAIAELEATANAEIEVSVLPLSTIDELVDKGYRQTNTAVVRRPEQEAEVSVTAQIPLLALQASGEDLEQRFAALVQLLVSKGLITEVELTELLIKLKASST
jgi:hypothetical protein